MKKIIGVVVVVVVIIAAIALGMNNNKSSDTMSNNGSTDTNSSSSSGEASDAVSTDQVKIDNFAFSPKTITVKVGTKVTWTNQDSVAHTVRETDGKDGPKSDNLNQNDTYSFTYNTAGTYKYYCSIHPDMLGTVIVTQ